MMDARVRAAMRAFGDELNAASGAFRRLAVSAAEFRVWIARAEHGIEMDASARLLARTFGVLFVLYWVVVLFVWRVTV